MSGYNEIVRRTPFNNEIFRRNIECKIRNRVAGCISIVACLIALVLCAALLVPSYAKGDLSFSNLLVEAGLFFAFCFSVVGALVLLFAMIGGLVISPNAFSPLQAYLLGSTTVVLIAVWFFGFICAGMIGRLDVFLNPFKRRKEE